MGCLNSSHPPSLCTPPSQYCGQSSPTYVVSEVEGLDRFLELNSTYRLFDDFDTTLLSISNPLVFWRNIFTHSFIHPFIHSGDIC
jgi:hypothetical protein